MTDLSAGPSAGWDKLTEKDTTGEYPNPEAEAVRNALEKAAQIADRQIAADRDLQKRAVDPALVTIAILTGLQIARDIRALIPAQDSKQPEPS
jgi:hypothetical protein